MVREQVRDARQEEILEAAIGIIASDGVEAVSMAELAKRTG